MKALLVWADKESVPAIVKELERPNNGDNWKKCLDVLARLKDERGAVAVLRQLADATQKKDQKRQGEAFNALKDMGPVAEKATLPLLSSPQAGDRHVGCQLLMVYGGKDSLDKLQELKDKDSVKQVKTAAETALKEINTRNP